MSNSGKGKGRLSDRAIRNPIIPIQPDQSSDDGPPDHFSVVHSNVLCDGPQCRGRRNFIQGIRYACSECGCNFCQLCVRDDETNHDESHQLFACRTPCTIIETSAFDIPSEYEQGYVDELDLIESNPAYFGQEAVQRMHDGDEHPLNFIPQHLLLPRVQHHPDPDVQTRLERGEMRKYKHDSDLWDKNRPLEPSSLDSISVRLLHLHPGMEGDKLRCSFSVVHLDDESRPNYELLSSSWHRQVQKQLRERRKREAASRGRQITDAEETRRCAVYVGEDRFLEVGFELYEALKTLRHQTEDRIFWNRELCFDKKDPDEKWFTTHCLPMIYHSATQMIVWADCGRDSTDMGMALWMSILEKTEHPENLSVADMQNDEDLSPESEAWDDAWQVLFQVFPRGILDQPVDFRNVIFAREAVLQIGQYDRSWANAMKIAKMLSRPDWLAAYYGPDV